VGSSPTRPTCGFSASTTNPVDRFADRCRCGGVPCRHDECPSGHIEQLPSGSWRAKVYAGKDPLTGREICFRETRRTEIEAQIELGKLLALARAGRQPDSDVTVAELLDQYVPIAGWDLSTEETNLGYIRRTIKPALGIKEVRRVRGPLLDNLYARLQRCGSLACAGKPFTEHRHVPDLRPDPSDARMEWKQAADKLREAITCGALTPGDEFPSVPELARLQGLKAGTIRHAFLVLADEGLLVIRHGRTTQVAGEPACQSYARVTIIDSHEHSGRHAPATRWPPSTASPRLALTGPTPKGLNQWERTALELAEERSQLGWPYSIAEADAVDALRLGGLPVAGGGPKHVDSGQPDLEQPTPQIPHTHPRSARKHGR
jgi:DNA-binding transcriptional regulator YhcF (GntR family)